MLCQVLGPVHLKFLEISKDLLSITLLHSKDLFQREVNVLLRHAVTMDTL